MKKSLEEYLPWKLLIGCQRLILSICSAVAVVTIVLSVVLRYVLKADLYGLEEIVTLISMWLYFMGGVYASYEDSHISADIVSGFVSNQTFLRVVRIIVCVITLACSLVLAKWGIDYILWRATVGGETISLHIPLILSQVPLAICFVLMLFYNIYHVVNAVIGRTPKIVNKEGKLP